MAKRRFSLAFGIAGSTFVLCWLLFALFFHNPSSQGLFVLGNLTTAMGLVLILLAIGTLRARGRPEAGKDFAASTVLVRRGVYAVVRHPLYLGWLLLYPAAMLVSQHWLVILLGTVGAGSMLAICREADRELVGKFGAAYAEYMREVPRLNLVVGIARKAARRKERQNGQ